MNAMNSNNNNNYALLLKPEESLIESKNSLGQVPKLINVLFLISSLRTMLC
jgi:hypothetical protein